MMRSLSWTMADAYSLEDLDTKHDKKKKKTRNTGCVGEIKIALTADSCCCS